MNKNFENVNVDKANIGIMESLIIKDLSEETPKILVVKNDYKITRNDGKNELPNLNKI